MATLENAVIKNKQDIATNATNIASNLGKLETKVPNPNGWTYIQNNLNPITVPELIINFGVVKEQGTNSNYKIISCAANNAYYFNAGGEIKGVNITTIYIPNFLLK